MSIPKFTRLTTTACPLNIENIDTDQIIPARFLKAVERKGFGDNLFRDWRFDKAGARVDGFPLNDSRYGGEILVAAKNFGCGSSREHAAWAIFDYGFRVVVSSFQRAFLGKDLRCDRGRSAGSFRGRSAESDVHDSLHRRAGVFRHRRL